MEIKIAAQWVMLLLFSGFGMLLLTMGVAFTWRMFNRKDFPSFEHAYRMWSEYNEKHDNRLKTIAEQQEQIADLKRELEEMKRKE